MSKRAAALIITLTACGSFGTADEAPTTATDAGTDAGATVADGGVTAEDASVSDGAAACTGWDPFDDAFERTGDVRGAWLVEAQRGDGITLSLGTAPVPRGASLHVVVATSTADRAHSLDDHVPVVVPKCVELTFALLVVNHNDQISSLVSIEMNNETAIGVWMESNILDFVQQTSNGTTFQTLGYEGITPNEWHTIKLRYRATAGAPEMSGRVDGKEIPMTSSTVVLGAPAEIRVGAGYAKATAEADYWIDDVSIR